MGWRAGKTTTKWQSRKADKINCSCCQGRKEEEDSDLFSREFLRGSRESDGRRGDRFRTHLTTAYPSATGGSAQKISYLLPSAKGKSILICVILQPGMYTLHSVITRTVAVASVQSRAAAGSRTRFLRWRSQPRPGLPFSAIWKPLWREQRKEGGDKGATDWSVGFVVRAQQGRSRRRRVHQTHVRTAAHHVRPQRLAGRGRATLLASPAAVLHSKCRTTDLVLFTIPFLLAKNLYALYYGTGEVLEIF